MVAFMGTESSPLRFHTVRRASGAERFLGVQPSIAALLLLESNPLRQRLMIWPSQRGPVPILGKQAFCWVIRHMFRLPFCVSFGTFGFKGVSPTLTPLHSQQDRHGGCGTFRIHSLRRITAKCRNSYRVRWMLIVPQGSFLALRCFPGPRRTGQNPV
jgi:hypothetical protein